MWTHLDRLKAGTNMRGPGEKQLESDRRLVDQRIQELKKKLAEIEGRKERAIANRADCVKIALVGYTNAGKSSLHHALTGSRAPAKNRLFETLDTRTTRLELDRRYRIVISDTVGFIRNLPHNLVACFHATLAEVIEADLLLHVVDAGQPGMEEQIKAVEEVLAQIQADHVPALLIFNKVDRALSRTLTLAFKRRYKGSVLTSAVTGEGLDQLREEILGFIARSRHRYRVRFPAADGALGAFLHRKAIVVDEAWDGEDCIVTIDADEHLVAELEANDKCSLEPAE
jgi:GTP-binding protein HflX